MYRFSFLLLFSGRIQQKQKKGYNEVYEMIQYLLWQVQNVQRAVILRIFYKNQNMIFAILTLALYSTLIGIVSPAVSPTWSATSKIKTGYGTFFSSVRGAGTSQSYSLIYPSIISGGRNPYLAYGIQRYRGVDYLVQQSFSLRLISSDFMSCIINIQITNITNILIAAVSYIAVDPTFPYYFNVFTEVPHNYGSALTNFSNPSTNTVYHNEVVDYTNDQNYNYVGVGPGSTYTTFSAPYTQYKIALFLTALSITATSNIAVTFDVNCKVIDSNFYSMNATLSSQATISVLEYSQVFFDSSQFSTTSNNYLYFQEWSVTNTATTSFFQYNSLLSTNFMMGLKSFTATQGICSLDYQWVNANVGSTYGAQIQASIPYNGTCALSGSISTILFMMSWSCPGGYPLFDLTTQMCLSSCYAYTYLNTTDNTCRPCLNTVCYSCNANDSTVCLTCATNFQLVGNTCICDTSTSVYYYINGQCYSCSDLQSNCETCSYTGNLSAPFVSSNFVCLTCNATKGYFINPFDICVTCSVSQCATCIGYATCSICNNGYGVTAYGTCSTCPLTGCQTCINITACSVCQTGYFKINNLCYTCPVSCTCGGYTLPKYPNGDCSTICGDGIVIFPYEGCDDGNANSGDGCSSTCQVEANSSCSGQPSVCYFTSTLTAALVDTQVSPTICNVITVNFKLTPDLILLSNKSIVWTNAVASQNTSVLVKAIASSYSNGVISETFEFSQNVHGLSLVFKVNPQHLLSPTYLQYTPNSSITFSVFPSNNIPAIYQSDSTCKNVATNKAFAQTMAGISYLGLLLSVFSCKIIGLEMFGVLQLSYFSLSNYDYVPPALIGLLQRKQINGLNIQTSSSSSTLPSRIVANGYNSSDFLANFNIMLLVTAAIAITGLVMYLVTYLINKQSMDQQQNLSQAFKSVENKSNRKDKEQPQSKSLYWHRMSKYILKEVLLTFIIFNMFNISYSAGIQIKYIQQVSSFSIICLLVTLTLILIISAAQIVTSKIQFGEYIDKFKKERVESKYMIATIFYRFVLGFLLAFINEWALSGVVYTFVSAAFLTYICFYDPFTDRFQNVRSKFVHSVHVLILFVNFYYRAEANSNPTESSQLYVPAYIQIAAVAISVFGSTLLLAYQAYLKIKTYLANKEPNTLDISGSQYAKTHQINQPDNTINEILD